MIRRSQKEQQARDAERISLAKRIAQALPQRNVSLRTESECNFVPEQPAPSSNTAVNRLGELAMHFAGKKLREAGITGVSLIPSSIIVQDRTAGRRMDIIRKASIVLKASFAATDGKRVANKSFNVNVSFSNGSYSLQGLQVGRKMLAVHKDVLRLAAFDEATTEDEGAVSSNEVHEEPKELSPEEMKALGWTPGFSEGDRAWKLGSYIIVFDNAQNEYTITGVDDPTYMGSANSLDEAEVMVRSLQKRFGGVSQKKNRVAQNSDEVHAKFALRRFNEGPGTIGTLVDELCHAWGCKWMRDEVLAFLKSKQDSEGNISESIAPELARFLDKEDPSDRQAQAKDGSHICCQCGGFGSVEDPDTGNPSGHACYHCRQTGTCSCKPDPEQDIPIEEMRRQLRVHGLLPEDYYDPTMEMSADELKWHEDQEKIKKDKPTAPPKKKEEDDFDAF